MKTGFIILGIVVGFTSAFIGLIYEQPILLATAAICFFSCSSLLD